MKHQVLILTLAGLAVSGWRSDAGDINSVFNQWNIITSGDLKQIGSDFEGRAYIGGNVAAANSFTVATKATENGVALPAGSISLAVGGNIVSGGAINLNRGSVAVGGSVLGNRIINNNSGGTVTQGNPSALPLSPVSQVTSASLYWSTLVANSGTSVAANGRLNFNCANTALAVFNLSASQMFGSGFQGFDLNTTASTGDVIINVSGTAANWTLGNFSAQFGSEWAKNHVVFNFYEATSVYLRDWINGYVVAPDGTVTAANNINGGVMCHDLYVGSEVHVGSSEWSNVPTPNVSSVPEASTVFSGVAALAVLLGGFISKRRKAAAQA